MSLAALFVASALAEVPRIALLTIEPGEDFVSKAGHATLCVRTADPQDKGTCYNYGSTNSKDELKLTLDYLRGTATFWVSTPTYGQIVAGHGRRLDRTVWKQDLDLPEEDAWHLVESLRHDAQPAHMYYQYDHFKDNCTSRLRDAIDRATNGALSRGSDVPYTETWRSVSRHRLAGLPWFLIGSELAGRPADLTPTLWDAMVLPEVLRAEVQKRLGSVPKLIHERKGYPLGVGPTWGGALWIVTAGLVLGGIGALGGRIGGRFAKFTSAVVLGTLGLVGLVFDALFAVSTLAEVRHNEVLLVFFATDALAPTLSPAWRRGYLAARISGLIGVMLLAGMHVFTQPTWAAFAVLIALVGVASGQVDQLSSPPSSPSASPSSNSALAPL